MIWSDFLVIIVILIFAIIGFKTGLVMTLYRFAAMIISFWLALQLHPVVTKFLMGTPVYNVIKDSIHSPISSKISGVSSISLKDGMSKLGLPDFLTSWIGGNNSGLDVKDAAADVVNKITVSLSEIAVKIIAVIVVFILAFIVLLIAKRFLKALVKLPVIKQFDKLLGTLIGALSGVIVAYLLCAAIIIFGNSLSTGIQKDVDKSFVSKYFIKDNFVVSILSKK
ncbi:MAG: CvpA family protein [Bacillota bacterium]